MALHCFLKTKVIPFSFLAFEATSSPAILKESVIVASESPLMLQSLLSNWFFAMDLDRKELPSIWGSSAPTITMIFSQSLLDST